MRPLRHRFRSLATAVTALCLVALAAPAGAHATATPVSAAAAPAAATGDALTPVAGVETDRGTAKLVPFPGGGELRVQSRGTVARQAPDGRTLWRLDSGEMYADWHVAWTPGYVSTTQMAWGTAPADPYSYGGDDQPATADSTPYAIGDLTGDGSPDVAVAEVAGINVLPLSCSCLHRFSVPGSALTSGTFVSVLDGRTGRMLWSELDPGYVTQLAIVRGRLVVGDETGDPSGPSTGAWGSATTVRGLAFHRTGSGAAPALAGEQVWQYATKAPWARLFGMVPTGAEVAVAWSDTPMGLGVPGPPDGHVVLLDAASGTPRWDARTAGYPTLLAADPSRRALVAVQTDDPTVRSGYAVTGLRLADGSAFGRVVRDGSLPLSLAVGRLGDDPRPAWIVGAVDATVVLSTPISYHASAGRVSVIDPERSGERWSRVLAPLAGTSPAQIPQPGGLLVTGGRLVVGSWGGALPTPAQPYVRTDGIAELAGDDGGVRWSQVGDLGDPQSLTGAGDQAFRTVSEDQDVLTYRTADGRRTGSAALFGDLLAAVPAHVAAATPDDVIAGDQSGAVYAFDGRDLVAGAADPRRLWETDLPGSVRQVQLAALDGRQVAVVTTGSAVGVLDLRTGRLRTLIRPAGYVWRATTAVVDGQPAVLVPTDTLTAYALGSGRVLWRYTPPAGSVLSDVAVADGVAAGEYTPAEAPGAAATSGMAAFGVDLATGRAVWTEPTDPGATGRGQTWNGVVASPGIPGADGHGVALTWALDGTGQVDVRDIRTGALDYRDTDDDLDSHTGFATGAGVGLVAVGQNGLVRIGPDGGAATYEGSGLSAVVVPDGAAPAVVSASFSVDAYPAGIFTGYQDELASDTTFDAGALVDGGAAADGSRLLLSLPVDWLAYQLVTNEGGADIGPYNESVQHGMALLDLTNGATGAGAATAPAAGAPAPGAAVRAPAAGAVPATVPVTPSGDTGAARVRPMSVALPRAAAATPYTPATMRAYLGLTGDGGGQTVAIVDAYEDPDIVADTEHFSEQFGLPGVCGAGGTAGQCFDLDVSEPDGTVGSDPDWSMETALDVEWVHAIAPRAGIRLVEARDGSFAASFQAVSAATATRPDAVSMSWGIGGGFSDETYYDGRCRVATTVCVVATGDSGHPGAYPAYNPSVLAVGGTSLAAGADGTVGTEQAWSGSGGGTSLVEPAPGYQQGVTGDTTRDIPDVSFDADPTTGVAVYDSMPIDGRSGWLQVGGTSLGAPVWSALLADADQMRAERGAAPLTSADDAAQRDVYALRGQPAIADVTTGPRNGQCPTNCVAGPGYDEVTGIGSPRAGIDAALVRE